MNKWDSEFGYVGENHISNSSSNRRVRQSNKERVSRRRARRRKRRVIIDVILVVAIICLGIHCFMRLSGSKDVSMAMTDDNIPDNFPIGAVDDIETEYPRVLLVNKENPVPEDYVPETLVKVDVDFGTFVADENRQMIPEAAEALEEMFNAAKEDGIALAGVSAYRSYDTQKKLYNNNVATKGQAYSEVYSARPGKSEHQTGMAIDISTPSLGYQLGTSFSTTKEGMWVNEHCQDYGYIVRYQADKTEITGYAYEPWHIRYVGVAVAKLLTERGITLEEYEGAINFESYNKGYLTTTTTETPAVSADASENVVKKAESTTKATATTETVVTTEAAKKSTESNKANKTKTTEAKPKSTEAPKATEAPKTTEATPEKPKNQGDSEDDTGDEDAANKANVNDE
ncbi:MAG: M15 family metallopeptidase [Lachnospiraceae bacterium]|nr:M15 family metallopeptidase [Lachnospiraceae bacterium]